MNATHRWFVAALAFCTASSLFAQSSQQITINAVVPVMMNLSVDTNNVAFNFEQGDYRPDGTADKEMVNATTFKVAANTRWRLFVSSNNLLFSYSAAGSGRNPRKSCGDLSLSPNNSIGYSAVSVIGQAIASGRPGGAEDIGNRIPVSYKLHTSLADDPPGTYTLTLTFTLMPG